MSFNLTADEIEEDEETIFVSFEWEPSDGSQLAGLQTYRLCLTKSNDSDKFLCSSFEDMFYWNVSLEYNIEYTASLRVINCVGESDLLIIDGILFGK